MEGILLTPTCSWKKKGSLVLKHYSGSEASDSTQTVLTQCSGEGGQPAISPLGQDTASAFGQTQSPSHLSCRSLCPGTSVKVQVGGWNDCGTFLRSHSLSSEVWTYPTADSPQAPRWLTTVPLGVKSCLSLFGAGTVL